MMHALMALALAAAPEPAAPPPVMAFGIGRQTCEHWLSGPQTAAEGSAWILGYWSAVNLLNENNHLVGAASPPEAIVGAVQELCGATPAASLMDTAAIVYFRFQQDGK